MGGQACIIYGAAEFSRDVDLTVLADPENLKRLEGAVRELQADPIAVPPFERKFLDMGLAVHFRCRHPEAAGLRVDVLSRMRGVDPFEALWSRRTTVDLGPQTVETLSLQDLVRSKKTQRDKDWPMLARLVEGSYYSGRESPTPRQVEFWLRELRTPSLLVEAAARFPDVLDQLRGERALLGLAERGDIEGLEASLLDEERREKDADRAYWRPLREELERLRRSKRSP